MKQPHQEFYNRLEQAHSFPLWQVNRGEYTAASIQPHIWRWKEMRQLALDAGLASEGIEKGGERRSLLLINPGQTGSGQSTNNTTIAAIQMIKPGESATAHRHTAMALRFIIEGSTAYTVVNGEKVFMEEGDLVITPPWAWHDHAHANLEDRPMIWFDALDAPLAQFLDSMFIEPYPEDMQPVTVPEGYTKSRLGRGIMRNPQSPFTDRALPMIYKWSDAYGSLLESADESPFDGVISEYINPVNGGHTLPTTACSLQRLRPGETTLAHRHTTSTIYHVAKGSGFSVIDDERFDWEFGDTFVVPSWAWHRHGNPGSQDDAVLFSVNDQPVLEALGLYREQNEG